MAAPSLARSRAEYAMGFVAADILRVRPIQMRSRPVNSLSGARQWNAQPPQERASQRFIPCHAAAISMGSRFGSWL